MATATAAIALALSTMALVARGQPVSSIPRLVLAVGATFVPFTALAGLTLALLARRWALAVIGVFLLTATLTIQANWYFVGDPADIDGPSAQLGVLSSNLRYGRAEPNGFVSLASRNADIITVAELTPEAVERFGRAGIGQTFPYSQLYPAPGARGIGIWSRYPITSVTAHQHRNVAIPGVRVAVPGVEVNPLVASVHVKSPISGDTNTVDGWRYEMAGAKAQLDDFAQEAGLGAVIIGGDFNSTPDMRQFRDLLTNGYRDAVEQLGAGFAPTFRTDTALPPVITIDHILTRNAAVTSIRTVTVDGSDHRALLATVAVPLRPAAR